MGYGFDRMAMPTFRKWNQSYEGWLYQNGLLQRMHYLEAQKFLLRERMGKRSEWVYRLTEKGRALVHGGRNPEVQWQRAWDGFWRLLVFDLPVAEQKARVSLLRWLRHRGFGYLQDSVWISPDPVEDIAESLRKFREDAESFTILESRCAPGFSNTTLVTAAWPFEKMQAQYKSYEAFATAAIKRLRREKFHPRELFALLRAERRQWSGAFDLDPLLPLALWPSHYEGRRAWQKRGELLRLTANQTITN